MPVGKATPIPDTGSDPYDIARAIAKQKAQRSLIDSISRLQGIDSTAVGSKTLGANTNVSAPTGGGGNSFPVGFSGAQNSVVAPEPNLALNAITALKGQTNIDIQALMEQIKANYANLTGDTSTAANAWLTQLLGANFDPNDPALLNDPAIAGYIQQLSAMQETADANQATDLAWFIKQQEAQQAYLDSLMVAAQMPQVGSGGGGGGGYGGGGGGSGSGGSSDYPGGNNLFKDPKTVVKASEFARSQADANFRENAPALDDTLLQMFPVGSPEQQAVQELLDQNWTGSVPSLIARLADERINAETQLDEATAINEGNAAWEAAAPANYQTLLSQFLEMTGREDPFDEAGTPDAALPLDQANQLADFAPVYEQAYNPENFPGGLDALVARTVLQNTPEFRRTYLAPNANLTKSRISPLPQAEAPEVDIQGQLAALNSEDLALANPEAAVNIISQLNPQDAMTWLEANRNEFSPDAIDAVIQNLNSGDRSGGGSQYTAAQQLAAEIGNNTQGIDADVSAAVRSAQRAISNPTAMRFFFEDTYPALNFADRQVVDALLEQEGVNVPGQALTLSNQRLNKKGPGTLKDAVKKVGLEAPEPISQEEVIMGTLIQDGQLRPDILEAMQRYSQNQIGRQQTLNPNFVPEEGEWYNPNITAPEDLTDLQVTANVINSALPTIYDWNPNYTLAPTDNRLRDTAQTNNNITTTSNSTDPLAAELTGGDPNMYPLEDLDQVYSDPYNPQGFFGGGRNLPLTLPQAKNQAVRDFSTPAPTGKKSGPTLSDAVSIKKLAQKALSTPSTKTKVNLPTSTRKKRKG